MTKTKTCSNCKRPNADEKTVIFQGKIYTGCEGCLPTTTHQEAAGSAKYWRDRQREDYRRDITQPNQKEYARAYPEKFREIHGDDLYRKLA